MSASVAYVGSRSVNLNFNVDINQVPETKLTTAAGGVYSAASNGGDAIVAAGQVYTGLTGITLALDLTIAATPAKTVYNQTTVPSAFFALTTAQGAAATAAQNPGEEPAWRGDQPVYPS